jgi:hypothetical protein
MMKPGSFISLLLGTLILLYSVACTTGGCFEETESFLKATFYNNETKKAVAPDSVTLFGFGHDTSLIYNKSTGVQPALFPLNSAADTSAFVIKINGITDTIAFIYSTYPHLVSKECGFTFYHDLDSVIYTTHNIDYVYSGKNKITTINEENIRIFY